LLFDEGDCEPLVLRADLARTHDAILLRSSPETVNENPARASCSVAALMPGVLQGVGCS